MQLAFESQWLRTLCEQDIEAEQQLGNSASRALQHRLADLQAASSVVDLVAGHPRIVEDSNIECLVIDLAESSELVLVANHTANPLTDLGRLDWSSITRVKVVRIGGIHG